MRASVAELRNPLHVISSNVEFLLDSPLSPQQADFARSVDSMSLDFAKLDAGKMVFSRLRSMLTFAAAGLTALLCVAAAEHRKREL
jgi:signal transduction histidine kinase